MYLFGISIAFADSADSFIITTFCRSQQGIEGMRMKKCGAIGVLLALGLVACMTAPSVSKKSPAPISGTASVRGESKIPGKILELDYDGFTVWLDCDKRGPVKLDTTLNTTAAMRRVHRLSG
jgi:hypothetical protein